MNTLDLITYATLIGATACACVIGVRDSVRPAAQQAETVVSVVKQASPVSVEAGVEVPDGDTSFKAYMDWHCITNTRSDQYKLQLECWTDDQGLRRHGDDYVIALGTFYADRIGERYKITLDSGVTFTATVGDFKADKDTDSSNMYTPMQGSAKNVIEFVVDTPELPATARRMGDISYAGFEGDVERMVRLDG